MVIKHLENKIRLVGIICTAFLVGCIIISVSSIWTARTMVTDAQKKVYVLDGNVPILVTRTTMDETLDVEAKSHVEMFHHYFFTLAPDDKYIRYTMEKAMYLVDETGLAQYNTLKEKGFYSNILGTSAVFSIFCDSISFDKKNMEFTYYGRQRIERRSNILMRELVTAGQLKRVPRTDNNPHGLLIVNWRTLLNKDIEQKTKSIGVRKVMGATEMQMLVLLNKDFIKRLLIAFILICPIVYYVIQIWLDNFAYKTELSWWIFALAFVIMVVIALLCVSALTWRAATANPVNALKSE